MLYLLLIPLLLYVALVASLYCRQRHLIYHPDTHILAPESYQLTGFTEYFTTTPDNHTIQLWYRPAAPGFPTIIYYHGNAWHMGGRAGIYNALASRGFGVLAVSYRGYGKSSGHPSEAGLYHDARAAIAFLTDQMHIPVHRIMVFGESLGTGVAVQMAVEYDVAALILQAPYMSVSARAAEIYYYVPVTLLIKDKYNSLSKIARVKAPVLMFHGERDNVIPAAHGRRVFDAVTSPKQVFFFPDNGHNDFDTSVISEHVLHFAQTHHLIAE